MDFTYSHCEFDKFLQPNYPLRSLSPENGGTSCWPENLFDLPLDPEMFKPLFTSESLPVLHPEPTLDSKPEKVIVPVADVEDDLMKLPQIPNIEEDVMQTQPLGTYLYSSEPEEPSTSSEESDEEYNPPPSPPRQCSPRYSRVRNSGGVQYLRSGSANVLVLNAKDIELETLCASIVDEAGCEYLCNGKCTSATTIKKPKNAAKRRAKTSDAFDQKNKADRGKMVVQKNTGISIRFSETLQKSRIFRNCTCSNMVSRGRKCDKFIIFSYYTTARIYHEKKYSINWNHPVNKKTKSN